MASIQAFINEKQVGYQARLLGEVDGVIFDIFSMKDPDYTVKLISTYGKLVVKESHRENIKHIEDPVTGVSNVDKFRYTKIISNQFKFRGAFADHNKKRMGGDGSYGVSLDTTQRNIKWENIIFVFILAVIEVNTYLAMRYFGPRRKNFGDFWKNLAFELVLNKLNMAYGPPDSSRSDKRGHKDRHNIIIAPSYGKFGNGRWQKKHKENINNIVAAQGIAPTYAGPYENITRRAFYACHVLVNTVLRKLQSFR